RRNLTVLPLRSRISALAYSVNRFVQFSTSLVMSQTRFMGALMMMKLSVRLLMISPLFLQATVGVVDGLADGVDLLVVLVGDGETVLLLHSQLDLDESQRVQAHRLEGGVRVVHHQLVGQADAVDQDVFEIVEGELLRHEILLC